MGMAAPRVILTRPAGQSRAWRETLQSAGHAVLDWPLIETSATESPQPLVLAWQERKACRAWMFVSAPAVLHFFAHRPANDSQPTPRCWATGPGTRRALLQCGVPDDLIDAPPDDAGQFDTEHLWDVVRAQVAAWPPGQTVAIVRGTEVAPQDPQPGVLALEQTGVGRDWLAEQLMAQGVQVRWVVAYRRGPPAWDETRLAQAQAAAADGAVWVFSSSLAAHYLTSLLPGVSWARARAVATHERIAQVLRAQGWGQVSVCKPQASELSQHLASLESVP
jgi:uroporphyrinogen-III synthase